MTEVILSLAIATAFAYWCFRIAQKNGRSTGLAIFMGMFFGLLAVIIYAIIGKTKELKARELIDAIEKLVESKNQK